MKVSDFIEQLNNFPKDMEIVVINDYASEPSISIERYARGDRDEKDNLIIRKRVEIH